MFVLSYWQNKDIHNYNGPILSHSHHLSQA